MKTVLIDVSPLSAVKQRIAETFKTGKRQPPRISFPTHELFWKILTPKRMDLLKAMAGAGSLGVGELARLVARAVKGVHTDLTALFKTGIAERVHDRKSVMMGRLVELSVIVGGCGAQIKNNIHNTSDE